jgi:hypothetical protein
MSASRLCFEGIDMAQGPTLHCTLNGKEKEIIFLHEDMIRIAISHEFMKQLAGIKSTQRCTVDCELNGLKKDIPPGQMYYFYHYEKPVFNVTPVN